MNFKIKRLQWIQGDYLIAESPAAQNNQFVIFCEEDKYWASWDLNLPGTIDVEFLKRHAQNVHENYLMRFLEVD